MFLGFGSNNFQIVRVPMLSQIVRVPMLSWIIFGALASGAVA